MLVIVAYDIKNTKERNKVLNRVHKTCRMYLYQLQFSVFFGELNKTQFQELKSKLSKIVDDKEDMITYFIARNKNNVKVEYVGPKPPIDVVI